MAGLSHAHISDETFYTNVIYFNNKTKNVEKLRAVLQIPLKKAEIQSCWIENLGIQSHISGPNKRKFELLSMSTHRKLPATVT